MDWSLILAELPKAIPPLAGALVGGMIAVTGALAAQYLTHRFTRRREAETLLREKAEALLTALDQYPDWVPASLHTGHQTPSPLNRAFVLQKLYVPGLIPHFTTIRQTVAPVEHLRLELTAQPADLSRVGLQPLAKEARKEANVDMTKLLLAYLKAVERVTEAILAMPQWKARSLHKSRPRSRRRPLSATQHNPTTSLVGIALHCHETRGFVSSILTNLVTATH
jgi:hypothetical protein